MLRTVNVYATLRPFTNRGNKRVGATCLLLPYFSFSFISIVTPSLAIFFHTVQRSLLCLIFNIIFKTFLMAHSPADFNSISSCTRLNIGASCIHIVQIVGSDINFHETPFKGSLYNLVMLNANSKNILFRQKFSLLYTYKLRVFQIVDL